MDSVHNTFFGEVKNGGYETVMPCNEVVVFGIKADRNTECKVTPMLCGSFCIVLVADGTAHLSVNYKETQTANMKIGDRVRLTVDAIPGVEYIGAIEAISNATGRLSQNKNLRWPLLFHIRLKSFGFSSKKGVYKFPLANFIVSNRFSPVKRGHLKFLF